jgi:hypothetical protein
VPLGGRPSTLYTRWGDWFPAACAVALAGLALFAAMRGLSSRRAGPSAPPPVTSRP